MQQPMMKNSTKGIPQDAKQFIPAQTHIYGEW